MIEDVKTPHIFFLRITFPRIGAIRPRLNDLKDAVSSDEKRNIGRRSERVVHYKLEQTIIYFGESPEATDPKAHYKGVTLKCW